MVWFIWLLIISYFRYVFVLIDWFGMGKNWKWILRIIEIDWRFDWYFGKIWMCYGNY